MSTVQAQVQVQVRVGPPRSPPGGEGGISLFLFLFLCSGCAVPAEDVRGPRYTPTSDYDARVIEGWTVRVNKALLHPTSAAGGPALRLLSHRLHEVSRAIPLGAAELLRKVPIWLGLDDGHSPLAEYHPSGDWLREHGYNPEKAKGVEIGSASRFLAADREQPCMLLHELAHAYHDLVLGFEHRGLLEAYAAARAGGAYEAVLRSTGKTERHYAMKDAKEYFAEGSEAFFGVNDFYPFVRAELERHDPALAKLLAEVWK